MTKMWLHGKKDSLKCTHFFIDKRPGCNVLKPEKQ